MKKDAPVPTAARKKKKASPSRFQVSMKKATTEMLTLFLLRQKPMYTYEMIQSIEQLSGGVISFHNLYLATYRLQDDNYIQEAYQELSEDNRTRIYFSITPEGSQYLDQLIQEYRTFTQTIEDIFQREPIDLGETPPLLTTPPE